MVRLSLHELACQAGDALPTVALKRLVGASLANLHCALCLHRATPSARPADWQPGLNMPPTEIDALLELLLASRPGPTSGWLTVSFDDGYRDAGEYIRSRAPRFPGVEFIFFVSPGKAERRAGFRWDLVEVALRKGTPKAQALALFDEPMDLAKENDRPELRALGDDPDFRLSTLDELRSLVGLPNVQLGNHTDLHAPALEVADEVVQGDYRRSIARFVELFGPLRHFAFPFGTPRIHFSSPQVQVLRTLGDFLIWSTEARPSHPDERRSGAVLPRFPIDGVRSAAETAGFIAARSLKFRLQGTPHRFSQT